MTEPSTWARSLQPPRIVHASRFARSSLDKIFPDHWSFMLGEIAMYCFLVLIVTGVYRSDGDDTRAISDAVLATLKEDEPA